MKLLASFFAGASDTLAARFHPNDSWPFSVSLGGEVYVHLNRAQAEALRDGLQKTLTDADAGTKVTA